MVRDAMQHRGCRDWERLDVWSLGDQEADVIPADTGRAEGGLGSEWRSRLGGGGGGQCPGERLEQRCGFQRRLSRETRRQNVCSEGEERERLGGRLAQLSP